MQFTDIYDSPRSFSTTISNQQNNSLDIEKASEETTFVNSDLTHYLTTEQNIVLRDNVLMGKYYQTILSSCKMRVLSKEEQIKYNNNPELLSSDEFNTPSLWYMILKCNNCEDFSDFTNLPYVLIPNLQTILTCLSNEEYINNKDTK
jgi:hypothetical protein